MRRVWRRTGHPAPGRLTARESAGTLGRHESAQHLPHRMERPVTRDNDTSPLLGRWLAGIVLALMAASTVYTAWIVVANFDRIGV